MNQNYQAIFSDKDDYDESEMVKIAIRTTPRCYFFSECDRYSKINFVLFYKNIRDLRDRSYQSKKNFLFLRSEKFTFDWHLQSMYGREGRVKKYIRQERKTFAQGKTKVYYFLVHERE